MSSKGRSAQIKGKRFEREVANYLAKKLGVEVRRTPSNERWKVRNQGDVNARGDSIMNRYHWEAKNHKTISIKEWYQKASDDSGYRDPLVVFRGRPGQTLVALSLQDFAKILVELQGYNEGEDT